MSKNIAIDGPAGAGKSTIARQVAARLGYIYVDTGAMYRAMALYLLRQGVSPDKAEKIPDICQGADITISYEDGVQVVLLQGENVNGLIRQEEVGNMASVSSAVPEVRKKLEGLQKELAASRDVVMDGRDIGTKILPDAQAKIFLTADPAVRARRRYEELKAKGRMGDLQQIEEDIRSRDKRDMERKVSPLCQAEDAVLLDSSYLTIEEVIDEVIRICKEKGIF